MRKHASIIVALCIALGLHAVALGGTFQQGTATRTYERRHVRFDPASSSFEAQVAVLTAGGRLIDTFIVRVPASGAIVDDDGNQIAASVPAGLNTARTSFLTALDSAIDNAAAAGKFAR